jgi:hypothetical protein
MLLLCPREKVTAERVCTCLALVVASTCNLPLGTCQPVGGYVNKASQEKGI